MENKSDYETKALVPRQELTPALWQMLESVGMAFFKSGKMSITTASEGAVKALFCIENNLPLTAARGLYFVNGKLGIESGVIAALVRQHPNYDYEIKRLDPQGCTVAILRFGEVVGEASFTMEDAERAGLAQKHNYKSYPEDMFFAKAITRAQRRYAPDIFGASVYVGETMDDWNVIDVAPARTKPPDFDQLIERFGLEACTEAGVFTATNEKELWAAVDELAINVANNESEQADQERASEAPPTMDEIKQEAESPFKDGPK